VDCSNAAESHPILVSDFDGTMTEFDFYQLAAQQLVPPGTPDYWGEYLAGRLTHFEALRRIFTHIRADEATVMATAQQMNLDQDLSTQAARLQGAGWKIVVASAGCNWYIQRLLAAAGTMGIVVHANPGVLDPEHGLLMDMPVDSPYFSEQTGISKEAVVRDAIATHTCVAFAGDGRPDLPAAMLVPAERRFARGWLADELRSKNVPFHEFSHWSEIADILLKG
jgi:2-hydroxy-3-keto-5-methylthiopentenyl-1-phosphate phosphatase